jgi:hypothetical protein
MLALYLMDPKNLLTFQMRYSHSEGGVKVYFVMAIAIPIGHQIG